MRAFFIFGTNPGASFTYAGSSTFSTDPPEQIPNNTGGNAPLINIFIVGIDNPTPTPSFYREKD